MTALATIIRSPKADIKAIRKTSEILIFPQLIKFETAKFIHKNVNKKLPTIFDSYFVLANTTHSHSTRFIYPYTKQREPLELVNVCISLVVF